MDFEHGNIVCNFSVPANSFLSKIDQILWVDDERLLVACFSTLFLYDINLIQTNSIEIQNLHFARMSLQPDKTVWLSSSSPKTLLKINNDNTLDAPNMGHTGPPVLELLYDNKNAEVEINHFPYSLPETISPDGCMCNGIWVNLFFREYEIDGSLQKKLAFSCQTGGPDVYFEYTKKPEGMISFERNEKANFFFADGNSVIWLTVCNQVIEIVARYDLVLHRPSFVFLLMIDSVFCRDEYHEMFCFSPDGSFSDKFPFAKDLYQHDLPSRTPRCRLIPAKDGVIVLAEKGLQYWGSSLLKLDKCGDRSYCMNDPSPFPLQRHEKSGRVFFRWADSLFRQGELEKAFYIALIATEFGNEDSKQLLASGGCFVQNKVFSELEIGEIPPTRCDIYKYLVGRYNTEKEKFCTTFLDDVEWWAKQVCFSDESFCGVPNMTELAPLFLYGNNNENCASILNNFIASEIDLGENAGDKKTELANRAFFNKMCNEVVWDPQPSLFSEQPYKRKDHDDDDGTTFRKTLIWYGTNKTNTEQRACFSVCWQAYSKNCEITDLSEAPFYTNALEIIDHDGPEFFAIAVLNAKERNVWVCDVSGCHPHVGCPAFRHVNSDGSSNDPDLDPPGGEPFPITHYLKIVFDACLKYVQHPIH